MDYLAMKDKIPQKKGFQETTERVRNTLRMVASGFNNIKDFKSEAENSYKVILAMIVARITFFITIIMIMVIPMNFLSRLRQQ